MPRIAIIGAGVAGLAAAYGLRGAPVEVTMFEKSRGYGGRAATRGRYGCRYDYGAIGFSVPDAQVRRLVTAYLPSAQLVDVGRPTWTFDENGPRAPAESQEVEEHPWTYHQGISTLGKLLARFARCEIRRSTRVERLAWTGGQWGVQTDEGRRFAPYDAVVLTPPAPQTADLLPRDGDVPTTATQLRSAVEAVGYVPQFAYVFAYDRQIERPGPFHGLRSRNPEHPLAWIGFEDDKPGHARAGTSLLVVQTSPHWTTPRVDRDPEMFVSDVKAEAADVLAADLRHPTWVDTQRWRYARPQSALPPSAHPDGKTIGLFFAGDYVEGTGQVGHALRSGLDAAARLRAWEGN
jgi:predicted NAD/FAD-dependent oxidoreductase